MSAAYRTLTRGQFLVMRVARLLRTDPELLELVIDPPSDQTRAAIEAYRRWLAGPQKRAEAA